MKASRRERCAGGGATCSITVFVSLFHLSRSPNHRESALGEDGGAPAGRR